MPPLYLSKECSLFTLDFAVKDRGRGGEEEEEEEEKNMEEKEEEEEEEKKEEEKEEGKGGGGRVDLKKFKEENRMTHKDIKAKKCHKLAED